MVVVVVVVVVDVDVPVSIDVDVDMGDVVDAIVPVMGAVDVVVIVAVM